MLLAKKEGLRPGARPSASRSRQRKGPSKFERNGGRLHKDEEERL